MSKMLKDGELTAGGIKIVRALRRLEKLWEKHGKNLRLFNGQSLRYKGWDASAEIDFFGGINGEGGDAFEKNYK